MTEQYQNYIGGKWVISESRRVFPNINPADTGDVVGEFQQSTTRDVDLAVAAAVSAFDNWRKMPAPKRAEIIFEAGDILKERKEELAKLMTREMGKVLKEARGDVQEAIDTAFFAAGEGRRLMGETTPSELKDKFAMSIRDPVGVCAIITPWNFPMAIPSWKIFPALVCGNTMVFKPASDTPASAAEFVKILIDAGVPGGVLNFVTGGGSEVGTPLAEHPDVDLVSFTGSSDVGRTLAESCGRNLKRLSLEMGGKNAQIIMDDADIDNAVDGALWGAFGTAGQRCTATSRIILHKKIAREFTEKLVSRAEKLRVGNGLDEKVEIGPCINGKQREKVHGYVEVGKREGAKLLTGGKYLGDGKLANGFFYAPTIFDNVKSNMRIAQEEIFGPVTALIHFETLEEAIKILNSTKYGLSASIYTKDVNNAFRVVRDARTGICYVNAPTIGAEVHLPFGGTKNTGNGHREAGSTVLDIFTEWKSVYIDYSGKLQKAQIQD